MDGILSKIRDLEKKNLVVEKDLEEKRFLIVKTEAQIRALRLKSEKETFVEFEKECMREKEKRAKSEVLGNQVGILQGIQSENQKFAEGERVDREIREENERLLKKKMDLQMRGYFIDDLRKKETAVEVEMNEKKGKVRIGEDLIAKIDRELRGEKKDLEEVQKKLNERKGKREKLEITCRMLQENVKNAGISLGLADTPRYKEENNEKLLKKLRILKEIQKTDVQLLPKHSKEIKKPLESLMCSSESVSIERPNDKYLNLLQTKQRNLENNLGRLKHKKSLNQIYFSQPSQCKLSTFSLSQQVQSLFFGILLGILGLILKKLLIT